MAAAAPLCDKKVHEAKAQPIAIKSFVGLFCGSKVCDTTIQVIGEPLQVCKFMVLPEEGGRRLQSRSPRPRVQIQKSRMGQRLPDYPSGPSAVTNDKQSGNERAEEYG